MSDGKKEGGTEQLIGWTILLLMVLACFYLIYKQFTPETLNIVRWIRFVELWIISLFTFDSYSVTLPSGQSVNIEQLKDIIPSVPSEDLDTEKIGYITSVALYPIKWIIIAAIGLIGLWAYTKGPGTQFTEVFNLDGFIRFQSKNFPIISPFVQFNPSKQPPRPPGSDVPAELPAFAEALGPEEWIAYNQIPIKDTNIDKNATYKAFARQLGPRWKGSKNLAPYKQVLLAVCCLKASRKRDEADVMLGRIASCWSHKKGLKLSKDSSLVRDARKVLKNKDLSFSVLKNCNQHAFQTTALLRAILTAREEGGVLAPAQFVWLRAYDRNLWYPLNNLGRQSNHTEAIGAMAHFREEKRAQRPIPKPKVQDAVDSMLFYLNSSDVRPIPKLDYSKSSNKRGIKKLKQS